jgi:hypothetical protein
MTSTQTVLVGDNFLVLRLTRVLDQVMGTEDDEKHQSDRHQEPHNPFHASLSDVANLDDAAERLQLTYATRPIE